MADPARLLFVVGAPRSGTTWLQGMLGDRPEIATPQETDLFRLYLDPVVQAWNRQVTAASTESGRRRKGLPFVLTEAEFLTATGALLSSVLAAVLRMKPTAEVVVEKSPAHSLSIDTIVRYAPEARFIHMVRDGRDAAASMVAASSDWGSQWAAPTVGRGARVWKQYVEAARTATGRGSGYLELRYEDLRGSEGPRLLQSAYELAGVTVSQSEAAEALARHSFERQAERGSVAASILTGGEAGQNDEARREPQGFYRRGEIGGWRDEWSVGDRQAFAAVGGELLVELGYEVDDAWVGASRGGHAFRTMRRRGASATASALRTAAGRLARYSET